MIDIVREIQSTQREVGESQAPDGATIRSVRLRRDFEAPIEDVWDALTNPERIGRWFLPISGDYRLGGRYQFEGNAGGEILVCEAPNRLKATWVYGEMSNGVSEVEIRLTRLDDERTRFEFDHSATVPEEQWGQFGPGAVGVGWDGGLLGLSLHLQGGSVGDGVAWQLSDEGRAFLTRSSQAWGEAHRASGADEETVATGVANTTSFYAPDPEAVS
jgi:uncharacterized protein YndB with AHSA1/START domain